MTFTEIDIIYVLTTSLLCSTLATFHRVVLPNAYVPYLQYTSNDDKKTLKSALIRLLYLILLTTILLQVSNMNTWHIVTGTFISTFLNIWPAIKQYQLLRIRKSDAAWRLFFAYSLFIVISCSTVLFTSEQLIPTFYNQNTAFLFFSNPSMNFLISVLLYLIPISTEKSVIRLFRVVNDKVIDTFKSEIKVLEILLNIENPDIKPYMYYIENSAKNYNISPKLLKSILFLESVYRHNQVNRFIEYIVCRFFKTIAIKKDITVGLAQVKISTAARIMKKHPLDVIPLLINRESNIEICAKYLKEIIEEYHKYFSYSKSNDLNIHYFIASKYLGNLPSNLDYSSLVYATVLENNASVI